MGSELETKQAITDALYRYCRAIEGRRGTADPSNELVGGLTQKAAL